MTKVRFESVRARISDWRWPWGHEKDYARCDLALPSSELAAIASLIETVEWVNHAAEHEGAIHIQRIYDTPWLVEERAYHAILSLARAEVTKALDVLRTRELPEVATPVFVQGHQSYHRGSHANISGGAGAYVLPERNYEIGFVVVQLEDGSHEGYFLTPSHHDRTSRKLAASLMRMTMPEAGVGEVDEKSYGQIDIRTPIKDIERMAVACHRAASGMMANLQSTLKSMQHEGRPSVFNDEDDDARDMLLQEIRSGAKIHRARKGEGWQNEADGHYQYEHSDGSELPHYIVERLCHAKALRLEGSPQWESVDDSPRPLVADMDADKGIIAPRCKSVRFQAFQSYCSQRRHDADDECAHSKNRSGNCSEEACPLVIQVYSEDVSYCNKGFGDDPAFDDSKWERNPLVRASHPNTERSFAWRASGEDAVIAIVNQSIHSKYRLGVENHLFGNEHLDAVRKAVEMGHLDIVQEMPGFGLVVKPSSVLIEMLESQARKTGEDAAQEMAKAP